MKPSYTYSAVCINVVDGDTIDCVIDLGFYVKYTTRLRLYGINTPEIYGPKSKTENKQISTEIKKYLENLILNKQIVVQTFKDKQDKYGRYLANVFLGNVCVNDNIKVYCKENYNLDITYVA